MRRFKIKNILVTGAYGGMGRATVQKLKAQVFRVFALDKHVGEAEENVVPIAANVTDEESVRRAAETVQAQAGELFAVIHFAGVYMLDSLVEIPSAEFEKIFEINVFGAFYVNKAFLPLLGSRRVDAARISENVVYLELLRNGYDVYVGKIDEFETDFVSQKGKETLYYQVALTVRDENTLKRELRPLTAVKDRYPKFVLTLDDDPEMQYDGISIMNARDRLPEKTD